MVAFKSNFASWCRGVGNLAVKDSIMSMPFRSLHRFFSKVTKSTVEKKAISRVVNSNLANKHRNDGIVRHRDTPVSNSIMPPEYNEVS